MNSDNEKNVIDEIQRFVEKECKNPKSKYGYEPFENHFIPVVEYSKTLLKKEKNADEEIVEIAAWLHDIGSIIYGRENHHLTGAEIAERKLRELNYPEEKIEIIKKCILNHRGSVEKIRESVEKQIVADADGMANFDNLPGMFMAAFVYENKNQKEARNSVREKLQNCFNKLSLNAKEIIKPKFEAIMLVLR
ncbi:HD domain-containing protein [Candidatus Pacearchaeota archaeon]|nr:HD domain-containing protein [Candidatus Pacearchaeota archaeon]